MNHSRKVALFALLAGFGVPGFALAQDPNPGGVKPNVLLIVDSSGSMEYKTGSEAYPTCTPGNSLGTNEKSRWIDVVEVLTGSITDYSCQAMDRTLPVFRNEFATPDGDDPPDTNYRNPYHRPLSYGCAISPDRTTSPANAFEWVPPVEAPYPVDPVSLGTCTTSFTQAGTGFIDAFSNLVRFGLMTFDTETAADTGHVSVSPFAPEYSSGVTGAWSYFGTAAKGRPADCSEDQFMEVGVRNGAAPASEGKMIFFGDQDADGVVDAGRHDRIEKVLLATRPYGATPINGALHDARYFFWEDIDDDPLLGAPDKLSPRYDDYVECGCREQHIILITDGEPNLDLRPECEPTTGVCPFEPSAPMILRDLYNQSPSASCATPSSGNNRHSIKTHVVGFSTATYAGGTKDCEALKTDLPNWNTTGGACETTDDEDLKVCCTLHELASEGSGGLQEPYIAPDSETLQKELSDIISGIISATASGTRPVMSPGKGAADSSLAAFRLLTSFSTSSGTSGLWRGNIERQRFVCNGNLPEAQAKDEALGDDFAHNTEKHRSTREFITYIPTSVALDRSIRPFKTGSANDGLGASATAPDTQVTGVGTSFLSSVPPAAMEITGAEPACAGTASAASCRDRILQWNLGYPDGASPANDRCTSSSDRENCTVIGDVLHSTPVIVNRPAAPVEDETYDAFMRNNSGRMMMAYVSSNDGQLHGFATSPNKAGDPEIKDDLIGNEYFSFIPPKVLPLLKTQYPGVRLQLLDGVSVVKDVVATGSSFPYALERAKGSNSALSNTWRTIMVQSFGDQQSGYFALDITDAERPGVGNGPRFLWQVTTTESGVPLFGDGGTPLITTVNINDDEVAVAVLPGGNGGSPSGICDRNDSELKLGIDTNSHQKNSTANAPGDFRTQVPCYDPADRAARSLTIVRLDTGEIIRTFRNAPAGVPEIPEIPTALYGATPAALDSPISGAPAAFPAGTGMLADRVFVGDQDGTMWRVDVSLNDPSLWTMRLFYDAYSGKAADAGKPIEMPPVLSVNDLGQITVGFGTGAQDLSGGPGDDHFIYSLTEADTGSSFVTTVNWYEALENGHHMIGPMTLFGGIMYFTTINPDEGNACSSAPGYIWGLHYVNPFDDANRSLGGAHGLQLKLGSLTNKIAVNQIIGDQGGSGGGAVFGVSLEFPPSCASSDASIVNALGGSRTRVTKPNPSEMQLVFQTGSATTSQDGLNFETSFEAVTLAAAPTASTIYSWASILE